MITYDNIITYFKGTREIFGINLREQGLTLTKHDEVLGPPDNFTKNYSLSQSVGQIAYRIS